MASLAQRSPKFQQANAPTALQLVAGGADNLPQNYREAVRALAACDRLDECQRWADKHAALASYTRQWENRDLFNYARRIQLRAVRRCGELLMQIPSATGAHRKREGDRPLSRSAAAAEAGLSEHRRKQALRTAAIAWAVFEHEVESATPPTATALAAAGKAQAEWRATVTRARAAYDDALFNPPLPPPTATDEAWTEIEQYMERLKPLHAEVDRAALLEQAPTAADLRRWARALDDVHELQHLVAFLRHHQGELSRTGQP